MIKKITKQLNALGITIKYAPLDNNGFFGIYQDTPIIIINDQLDTLATAITLLHESYHFLNGDETKTISNYRQNSRIEYEANRFMIHHILLFLDETYEFTPLTNFNQIRASLSLPSCLDYLIDDELYKLIQTKFGIYDDSDDELYVQEHATYVTTRLEQSPVKQQPFTYLSIIS